MATQWGRKETIIWPPHVPMLSYTAVAAALLCTCLFIWQRFTFSMTPLQRSYITEYIRSDMGAKFTAHESYRLLYLGGGKGKPRLAFPVDFVAGETTLPNGRIVPVALSELATAQGYRWFYRGPEQKLADLSLNRWLRLTVFEDKGLLDLFAISFVEGGVCLAVMLWFAVPYDIRRFKQMKYGRILRGPQLLSPSEFNRQQKGDGIGFKTTELGKMMRIPARKEAQHFQIMGDTGVGKTQLIVQMLCQIQERGESAIVYDPACEYLQRFYDKDRGDIVLNPLDERCPYWGPANEMASNAEADAIAASLYQPATDAKDEFFHQTPAQIFAHLLRKGPTPHQLAEWMANSETLEQMVAGTEMSFYIDRKAGPQRAGVLASLGLVAKCFRLLPEKNQTDRTWNARTWAKERKGWIFITSRPPERETLRPLHSLWIDLLVMRLLTAPQPGQKPVWFVIDELASLQKLPQLHTAITENRKSKNPLVLGFQGKAQLEVIYGHMAEVMLSQPATKIFMKTAEPKAAEWISEAIGKVEIERLKETKFDGSRAGKNFTVDRQIEPLVMGSEISGLDDRHAYLKLGNNVARFDFDYLDLPTPTPAFVSRQSADGEMSFDPDTLQPRRPQIPVSEEAAATTTSEPQSGGGAPLAHKKTKQTASGVRQEESVGLAPEVGSEHDDPENVRVPFGQHHVGLHTMTEGVEQGIFQAMLTISKPLSSGQAQSYHKLEFTSETQNYYKQGDAVRGEWQGQLAARLGVSGEVSPLEFSRLAEGKNPATDEQMVRHRAAMEYKNADGTTTKSVEHRAGWDATFSAPKSVSLTALVGGDDRVREAHRAAVTTALDELERYTQARIGGNHPAETTGKFISAKFEHDTARPVDGYAAPQLHTHAVIFNVTERADGSTRAIQPQGLFDSQNFATAVYQSELTLRLSQLGYEIEPGRSGAPEIRGYSQEYLDASSPRSRQIREQLEKTGYRGPEAAQIAAHSTRDRKQPLTAEEVLAAHKEMAASFGNQAHKVVATAYANAQQQEQQPQPTTRAKEAVTYARDSIFEREAVADERTILRDALRRGMGETSYRDIRTEYDNRREAGEFRSVRGMKHDSGRSFTTPETISAERANIRYVLEGRNAVRPIMSAELARDQANTRSFLNASQRRVIEEVLNSPDRIHGLQGLAGSGKTTTLQTIREGAETSGYVVEGFAPTSKAAGQLREAGIDATTLQSFLARGHNHPNADPSNRHLYLLDESSLASTKQMRSFLGKLNPEDRVLVIGDTRQHQGVDAGRPFQQMQEAGMQTSRLDRIMRQKDPELLEAVQHLANNETAKGIAMLADQGRVTEIANGIDRIAAIAKDYAVKPENTIIVSPDNRSRQKINEAVRLELRNVGELPEEGQTLRTLAHRSDMTGADRTWAARYNVGDVLQYNTGSKIEGVEKGSFATVQSVNPKTNTLTVSLGDGSNLTYDPRRLKGVNVFNEVEREVAIGDRVQFTAPSKELGVANRDLGTVVRLEDGQMTLRMDGKSARMVTFETASFRHFDLGYAVTSHSSQGLTAGRVLVHIDTDSSRSLINNRLAYVSISRASDEARIYTNDAAALGERLSADVTKKAAIGGAEIPTKVLQSEDFNRKATPPEILATRTEELGISL